MGSQVAGEVKLRSGNPNDPPLIDPKFLSHPFDRRVAIESVRETLEFLSLPGLAKDQIRLATGPSGRSDEEILVSSLVPTYPIPSIEWPLLTTGISFTL